LPPRIALSQQLLQLTLRDVFFRMGQRSHGGDDSENLLQSPRFFVNRASLAAQILFFAAMIMNTAPGGVAANKPTETEFRTIYDQFLSAVRANDKNKIADLIAFPVSAWAVMGKGGTNETTISNRADFQAKYESLFTPFMRSHALTTKPQKITDDHYMIEWHDEDLEYSFEFEYAPRQGFRLTSYLIGPR
jgi:hypothetical protein